MDEESVRTQILVDLAGEVGENPLHRMDMCQVVALLLIPQLLQLVETNGANVTNDTENTASTRHDTENASTFYQDHENTNAAGRDETENTTTDSAALRALQQVVQVLNSTATQPQRISRDMLAELFEMQGELHVSNDILDEMVTAAGGEGTLLDAHSLTRAITSDIELYNVKWSQSLTTHYQDVFSQKNGKSVLKKSVALGRSIMRRSVTLRENDVLKKNSNEGMQSDEEHTSVKEATRSAGTTPETFPVKKVYTAPSIDTVADTYLSESYSVIIWVCMVVVYLAYIWDFDLGWSQVDCGDLSEFSCKLINGITRWLGIFIELR